MGEVEASKKAYKSVQIRYGRLIKRQNKLEMAITESMENLDLEQAKIYIKEYHNIGRELGALAIDTNMLFGDTLSELENTSDLVRIDKLTQLKNRSAYDEDLFVEVDRALQYMHPLSLIRSDIDSFKDVNTKYGHDPTDSVLRGIGNAYNQNLHIADFAYRWGGDEFAIILPETDIEEAEKIAKRLGEIVAESTFEYKDEDTKKIIKIGPGITLSQGIAMLYSKEKLATLDPKTVHRESEKLARCSDLGLYDAKNGGRNKICIYDPQSGISRT